MYLYLIIFLSSFELLSKFIITIKGFLENDGFKKYFYNSSWLIFEKIIRLIAGLFINVYVARYLGPNDYGIINYVISFVTLFAVIAPLGIDEILVSELLKNSDQQEVILGTAFFLKMLGIFLILLLISFSFLFDFNDFKTNTFILVFSLSLLFQPFNVIDFFFQSTVKAKYGVMSNIFTVVLSSIIRVVLVIFHAPLFYFILVSIIETFCAAAVLIFFYKRKLFSFRKWKFDLSYAKKLLQQSWPLIISGFVIIIYMRIDQIMIKKILGFDAVGNFSVAVRLTELWYFIPMAIGSSFFPALINSKNTNESIFKNRLSNLMTLMVVIALLISIPLALFSNFFVTFLFGHEYIKAAPVLIVNIWASVFVFIGVVSGKWFIIHGLNKISLFRSIIGAIANIGLNFFLIPKFGIVGAAISTVVCQIFQTYLSNVLFKCTRPLFLMQTKSLLLIDLLNILKNKKFPLIC